MKTMTKEEIGHLPVDAAAAIEFVSGEIASWEGVRVWEDRTGKVEFRLNSRCLGYLSDLSGEIAIAHLELSGKILRELILSGRACPAANTNRTVKCRSPGWVSVPMGTVSEVTFAIELFRHNYQ